MHLKSLEERMCNLILLVEQIFTINATCCNIIILLEQELNANSYCTFYFFSDVVTLSSGGSVLRAWNLPDGQMIWESFLLGSKPSRSLLLTPVSANNSDLLFIPITNICEMCVTPKTYSLHVPT